MAVTTVVFDVGETLVDEAATYARWQAEGSSEGRAFTDRDLFDDALDCFAALRERGLRLGAAGNMRVAHEDFLRSHVDFVGSSERWGASKPDPEFFQRVVDAAGVPVEEIVYIGDRVDNDVLPARAAGMTAVRIRRGAHAGDQTPPGIVEVASLAELTEALA